MTKKDYPTKTDFQKFFKDVRNIIRDYRKPRSFNKNIGRDGYGNKKN